MGGLIDRRRAPRTPPAKFLQVPLAAGQNRALALPQVSSGNRFLGAIGQPRGQVCSGDPKRRAVAHQALERQSRQPPAAFRTKRAATRSSPANHRRSGQRNENGPPRAKGLVAVGSRTRTVALCAPAPKVSSRTAEPAGCERARSTSRNRAQGPVVASR